MHYRVDTRQKGMTLIELLVTMCLAVLLIAVGVPGFQMMQASQTQTAATNNYVGLIQFARSLATAEARQVTLCTSSNNTSCTQDSNFANGAILTALADDGTETLIRVIDEVDLTNFDIRLIDFPSTNSIVFTDTGEVANLRTTASIVFCDDRGAEFGNALIMNPLGIVRRATDDDDNQVVNQHNQDNITCPTAGT